MNNDINEKKIIDIIGEKTGYKKYVVKTVISLFLEQVKNDINAGKKVHIRNFGLFYAKTYSWMDKIARKITFRSSDNFCNIAKIKKE